MSQRFVSHIVIAEQVLGLEPKTVLAMMNSGLWGDTYKPTPRVVMVERELFEQWVEKHKKSPLKKAI